jgi:hypothetical protein
MSENASQTIGERKRRGLRVAAPVLITTLGVGQLLTVRGVIPGVTWPWVLSLAVVGALMIALEGINKLSVVVGPALIAAALLSFLRQTARISLETEMPVLLIIVGLLWTAAHLLPLPLPSWIFAESSTPNRAQ